MPLRLFAAVHYLVLSGDAPDALSGHFEDFAAALVEHEDALRARVETHGVQTNEVQRCTMLLPTFLAATAATGLPLELDRARPERGPQPPRRPVPVPLRERDASARRTRCSS